ncbi:neutral amino acid transporter [Entomortierella beljakovae]|nr:neutral amino acid transporter [Entomortierella beljakovae]
MSRKQSIDPSDSSTKSSASSHNEEVLLFPDYQSRQPNVTFSPNNSRPSSIRLAPDQRPPSRVNSPIRSALRKKSYTSTPSSPVAATLSSDKKDENFINPTKTSCNKFEDEEFNEKEDRVQLERAHTYHTPLTVESNSVSNRRPHFIGHHSEHPLPRTDGEGRTGRPHTDRRHSFMEFLGSLNIDLENFSGENYSTNRRQSFIVPKDLKKRRTSLAHSERSHLKIYTSSEEIQEDETVVQMEETPKEPISFLKAIGMLFKSFIASGILFMPNAFKNGGILFSNIVMVVIALLCMHSFMMLVNCRKLFAGSYGDIGGYLYGRWMRYAVLFMIAISQFGFCCGYCIFFATQFADVVHLMGGQHLDRIVWIAIFLAGLIPFTLIRNISRLGVSVIIADICIITGLIYCLVYDIKELAQNNGSPTPLKLFNGSDFGLFIGTAVFSYEGIGMVIPICSSMKHPEKFPKALAIVLSFVCILLVVFGSMGYAAYGANVTGVILDSLPMETPSQKAGKEAIQLLYIIAIFLTTPLMIFPCIRIVEDAFFSVCGKKIKRGVWTENMVRIIVDVCIALVAYGGYYKLDIVISFVGSFACVPLLFIFPPLFHLKGFPDIPWWYKIADVIFVLFGLLVFVYTMIINCQNF